MITITITQAIILGLAILNIYFIIKTWRDRGYVNHLEELVESFLLEMVEDDDQGI